MSINPFMVPAPPSRANWMWASVTQLSPLRIRFDGEAAAVDATPDTLIDPGALTVGSRVWVQIFGNSMIIVGSAYGVAQDPAFEVEVTAPSFAATGDVSAGGDVLASGNVYGDLFVWPNGNRIDSTVSTYIGLLTSGGVALKVASGGVLISNSYSDIGNVPTEGLYCKGDAAFIGLIDAEGTYANTGTFTANVGIATSPQGVLYRITSSQRYKVAVQPEDVTDAQVMALRPKSYVDKRQFDAGKDQQPAPQLPRYLGLIAEDVAQIDNLKDLLVTYDTIEGLGRVPDAVSYDRLGVALVPVIQRLLTRVAELEAQLP